MKQDKLSDADANMLLGSDSDRRGVMRRTLLRDSDACCWVLDYDASNGVYEQLVAVTTSRVTVTIRRSYDSGYVQLINIR